MAKTLLEAVNAIAKRVGMVQGDDQAFTTLTSPAKQRTIDIAIQVVNEGIDELYSSAGRAKPIQQAQGTITLVAGTRSYALPDDLVRLRWPFIDKTNNQYLTQFPAGYDNILMFDPEQDDVGQPHWAAISPVDGMLYFDRAPTATEDGRVYTFQYDKDLELTTAAEEVPFNNTVFRSMVPAWVQLWKREQYNEFDGDLFSASIGRAARYLSRLMPRTDYSPRR